MQLYMSLLYTFCLKMDWSYKMQPNKWRHFLYWIHTEQKHALSFLLGPCNTHLRTHTHRHRRKVWDILCFSTYYVQALRERVQCQTGARALSGKVFSEGGSGQVSHVTWGDFSEIRMLVVYSQWRYLMETRKQMGYVCYLHGRKKQSSWIILIRSSDLTEKDQVKSPKKVFNTMVFFQFHSPTRL